jgi:hypothetical protein
MQRESIGTGSDDGSGGLAQRWLITAARISKHRDLV